MATAPGTVAFAGWRGQYGRVVELDHGNGIRTRYAHLRKILVKKGQEVAHREEIGLLGNSGRSTGAHVHYEILVDGKQVNPRKVKLPSGKSLKGADLEAFQQARAEIDRLRGDHLPGTLLVQNACGDDPPSSEENAAETC